jgi:hypothetical protein
MRGLDCPGNRRNLLPIGAGSKDRDPAARVAQLEIASTMSRLCDLLMQRLAGERNFRVAQGCNLP